MHKSRRGFTLIELLVVIAIIAILAAILFPVFAKAREKARSASCLSNIKQITLAIMQYTQDYSELLPMGCVGSAPNLRWWQAVDPYMKSPDAMKCPSKSNNARGYGTNYNLMWWGGSYGLGDIENVAGTLLVCDASQCATGVTGATSVLQFKDYEQWASDWQVVMPTNFTGNTNTWATDDQYGNLSRRPIARHMDGLNIGYLDGHVKWARGDAAFGVPPQGHPYGDPRNIWDNK